ncbi:MAG TPA: hypothetical protein VGF28_17105 [Thermoanaerobaculia bacterium]|jgi:hypothetical protein
MRTLLVLTVLFTAQLFAQTPHPLTAELQKGRLAVSLKEGKLSGPGADLLRKELATTQFFLLGEEHATAEIARFATALLPAAWNEGYRHLAVEVGPFSTAQVGSYESIEAYLKRYPWSLPFLSWKEEAELYAAATKLGATIWGIDQEFILSATPHLERLVALAKDDAARAAAAKLLERSRAGDAEMLKTKSPATVFMFAAKAEDLAALRATFTDPEALRLIDALEESRDIYTLGMTNGWQSNDRRAVMMKRLFAERYRAAVAKGEATPKVFVKLGATHTMRGRSMVGIYDLGNMIPELAAANGTRSFQIMVVPRGGFVNAHRPFSPNADDKRAAYDPAKDLPFDAKPLFDAVTGTEWSLFDLRPLRVQLHRGKLEPLEPRFRNVLWGYDAILVIPEVTPATLFE